VSKPPPKTERSLQNSPSNDPCDICVAVVLAPHGRGGEVAVQPLSQCPARFAPGAELYVNRVEGTRTLVVAAARPQNRRLLLLFHGVDSLDAAEELRGAALCVRRSQLAPLPEGEYYQFQLLGLLVRTAQGKPLGSVTEVLETGANDVLVTEQVLVPAIKEAIEWVDLEAGEIVVRGEEWTVPHGKQ